MVVFNRYAKSLYDLALEYNIVEDVKNDLNLFACNFKNDLKSALISKNISNDDKIAVIRKIFNDKISKITLNFLCVLINSQRIDIFSEIHKEWINIYNENTGVLNVYVKTVTEDFDKQKLCDKITKITGKKVNLILEIDKNILGGIIIKYGNTLIDQSIKTKLLNLNKYMKQGK